MHCVKRYMIFEQLHWPLLEYMYNYKKYKYKYRKLFIWLTSDEHVIVTISYIYTTVVAFILF